MSTPIEAKIDGLNALRQKASTLNDARRSIRLGASVEMKYKRFFWVEKVYMFGWGRMKSEPLPKGIERDFYEFLSQRESLTNAEIRKLEKELETISVDEVAA